MVAGDQDSVEHNVQDVLCEDIQLFVDASSLAARFARAGYVGAALHAS